MTRTLAYKTCADAAQVKTLIASNDELLQRYTHLNTLKHWQGNLEFSGQLVLNLNRLLAAQIKLDVDESRPELAYQKWRENFLFINRAIRQESTMIDRAIFLVTESLNLNALEYCLFKSPEIASAHADELNALLISIGLERYNLEAMARGDYKFINQTFMVKFEHEKNFHVEYIRNRLYRYQVDFLKYARYQPLSYDEGSAELAKKYSTKLNLFEYDWLNPVHSILSRLLTGAYTRGFEILKSMHLHNANIKLLNISVKIRQQKIAVADMPAFLSHMGAAFNNPITGDPIQWNAAKKILFWEDPWRDSKIEVRL